MLKKLYEKDFYRWTGNSSGGGHVFEIPQMRFIRYKRICEYYRGRSKILYAFYYFIYDHLKIKYGIDLPVQTIIGEGFLIEHINGIVINPAVIIGNNCNIYNGVTIGTEKRGKRKGNPCIGNCVWIGANSIIVGNIKIGDDVMIVPGSFVNFDVPAHSIVMGNPGKIITKENATGGYIKNKVGD